MPAYSSPPNEHRATYIRCAGVPLQYALFSLRTKNKHLWCRHPGPSTMQLPDTSATTYDTIPAGSSVHSATSGEDGIPPKLIVSMTCALAFLVVTVFALFWLGCSRRIRARGGTGAPFTSPNYPRAPCPRGGPIASARVAGPASQPENIDETFVGFPPPSPTNAASPFSQAGPSPPVRHSIENDEGPHPNTTRGEV
ncbi:hypothetical protein C8Q76DRAFT_757989 [Earliella scabrosa]|nr:hypothetical protein C8Q76DRAFT_757989 [Earliella scabrosa]